MSLLSKEERLQLEKDRLLRQQQRQNDSMSEKKRKSDCISYEANTERNDEPTKILIKHQSTASSSVSASQQEREVVELLTNDEDDTIKINTRNTSQPHRGVSNRSIRTAAEDPPFLEGRFMMTAPNGVSNVGRLRFKDIVNKETLQGAILSSFAWEDDWLWNHIPTDIPLCLVRVDAPPELFKDKSPHIHICVPPIKGFGVMHIKLMILIYPRFVRVTIGSANLVACDWESLENIIYIQDFQKLSYRIEVTQTTMSGSFLHQLMHILEALQVPSNVSAFLHKYEYSAFKGQLIFSRNTQFPMTSTVMAYGLLGLSKFASDVLQKYLSLGIIETHDAVTVDALTSSLGRLDGRYIRDFLLCAQGKVISVGSHLSPDNIVRILYPSKNTVINSRNGPEEAYPICLMPENFNRAEWPRHCLHQVKSKERGLLFHAKILHASFKGLPERFERHCGWYYAGSHNFTKAAWGWLLRPSSTANVRKKGKNSTLEPISLMACNYELGVVVAYADAQTIKNINTAGCTSTCQGINVFQDTELPIPWQTPVEKYSESDEPWVL